ncbi:MAG: hypothetical protein N0E44_20065 [Candidatus Thiodiazotropha lotti]|nr:hypothetical protein [Candidatus Thiodiazotropha lotti]MCW4222173.1 hypothetical protein [Candidatus Thiodiazotropha lotti]
MEKQIQAYNEFRAQLSELKELNDKLVFNYEDPTDNKAARSHVYKLRQTKSAIEKTRKKEKAESLEYGKRVDSEAKQIVVEIESMINVHAKPLAELEQREKDRIQQHKDHIEGMRKVAEQTEHPDGRMLTAAEYKTSLGYLEGFDVQDMEEFAGEAAVTKDECIKFVRRRLDERIKYEEEQTELERLRIEAEERRQKERDEQIAKEAEERAKREAEEKAKAEREQAEKRELQLKLQAEKAEREKAEAERRAELAAKEAEERTKREAEQAKQREADEAAKREANKRHKAKINRSALQAFVKGGLDEGAAKLAVELVAKKSIPNVTISY